MCGAMIVRSRAEYFRKSSKDAISTRYRHPSHMSQETGTWLEVGGQALRERGFPAAILPQVK